MTARAAILTLVAIGGLAPGCKKKKTRPDKEPGAEAEPVAEAEATTWAIDDVGVELVAQNSAGDGPETPPADRIDAAALARRIGAALRATDHFAGAGAKAPPGRRLEDGEFRVQVSYGVIPEGSLGGPSAFVAAEGTLMPGDPTRLILQDKVATERPIQPGEQGTELLEAFEDQIRRAVDEMIAGVVGKEALRGSGAGKVRTALESGEPSRVTWALKLVGHREMKELSGTVRELLGSSDSAIADTAIATAVALGDSRAVRVLTEGIDFTDHERTHVVIEASAALGGEEARQFLEFVATGHEDDDVKAHAADALERLKRRR